jgi:hypothetical protein
MVAATALVVIVDMIGELRSSAAREVEPTARSWKFNPSTARGKRVKTSVVVKVAF